MAALPVVHLFGRTAATSAALRDVLQAGSPLAGALLAASEADTPPMFDAASYLAELKAREALSPAARAHGLSRRGVSAPPYA
jgi:hypothetical protein